MAKAPYTPCKLYVDGAEGIAGALRVSRTRPERKHMHCLRWPIAEVPADARCFQLTWYKR